MKSASRTLVKSPPEVWEMLDQEERMQGLMSALLGRAAEIEISMRAPESRLVWEAVGDGERARIEVDMEEKGWGTHVEVKATCERQSVMLDGWLDAVMEELATPEKRPFQGMVGDDALPDSSEPPAESGPPSSGGWLKRLRP